MNFRCDAHRAKDRLPRLAALLVAVAMAAFPAAPSWAQGADQYEPSPAPSANGATTGADLDATGNQPAAAIEEDPGSDGVPTLAIVLGVVVLLSGAGLAAWRLLARRGQGQS